MGHSQVPPPLSGTGVRHCVLCSGVANLVIIYIRPHWPLYICQMPDDLIRLDLFSDCLCSFDMCVFNFVWFIKLIWFI